MITLEHVSKAYRLRGVAKPILHDLSFAFPQGRNIAVMGPNGAGKSTLLRLIAGTETPDAGRIRRAGRVSWPLGFSGGFNGAMTGVENIRFVARIYGAPPAPVIASVRGFSELGASLDLPIKTYSHGMKARLAFGLSLALDFDCYLIDEITAVGDAAFRRRSRDVVAERLAGAQIVMVSHSAGAIRDYCDCGLLLAGGGRVLYYDDVEALLDAYGALDARA